MSSPALNPAWSVRWPVQHYDLGSTLSCGQAFRWQSQADAWVGVIGSRWVRLRQQSGTIEAEVLTCPGDWSWLRQYLQVEVNLDTVIATFPKDDALQKSIAACWGLRLLRQDPWECLGSFILSASKQIIQIQQIIGALSARWGEPVSVPAQSPPAWSFPRAERLASADEAQLRACKMGFRAPNLLSTARKVADGKVDLIGLQQMDLHEARAVLMDLPGVGRKIADCVLLFAYGFERAFPVDVWVMKALRQLYFPRRRPSPARLHAFIGDYFGSHAGYAQQYLFHYMRHHRGSSPNPTPGAS